MKILDRKTSVADSYITEEDGKFGVYMDVDKDNIKEEKPVQTYETVEEAEAFLSGVSHTLWRAIHASFMR